MLVWGSRNGLELEFFRLLAEKVKLSSSFYFGIVLVIH